MKTRILLISDIHANFPALEALGRQIRVRDFDYIFNCGDSVVYAPFPNETVQWLRRYNVVSILGNTDLKVLILAAGKSFTKPRREEKQIMYTWTLEQLQPENLAFLSSLPQEQHLVIRRHRICLFHGSPENAAEHLFNDTPEARFAELAGRTDCQIIITGHSHTPYHKKVRSVHFINPGSVGRMFDGNPAGSYAVLTLTGNKVWVEHSRFQYDIEPVVRALRKNNLPAIYGEMFLRGRKLN